MPLLAPPTLALNNAVPFARPIPLPPNANGLLPRLPSAGILGTVGASLALIEIAGQAGGYKWRDDLLAKIGIGTVSKIAPSSGLGTVGIAYNVYVSGDAFFASNGTFITNKNNAFVTQIMGGDTAILTPSGTSNSADVMVTTASGQVRRHVVVGTAGANGAIHHTFSLSFTRADGQPETIQPTPTAFPPVPIGYTPTNSPFRDNDRKVGTPNPIQASRNNGYLGALGLGGAVPVRSSVSTPARPTNPSPVTTPLPVNPVSPTPSLPPLKEPPKERTDKPKTPVPINPVENKPPDLGTRLRDLGAIIALIASNTQFDSLKNAAKTGSCETMKSPSCTKDMEDRIKNPINDKIDVKTAGLAANQAVQDGLLGSIIAKVDAAKTFSEKVARAAKLDKIYNLLTFITVIHNAQMLSNSLATTLMDSLSLGLATFGVKDENESPIDIQSIINKSVEDTVKSIIGAANYTTLSDRWKKAVRVYQAAANITYQVRSLWDSAKSLAELTGANVGKIGNALRRDGVVAENAYGAMADNPMAVNSVMTKLQNLDETASHLNSITSEAYGVTETVTQIKKDQDDFKKLVKEGTSSTTPIVNDQQKAKDDAAKLASVSPAIATTDLAKPD